MSLKIAVCSLSWKFINGDLGVVVLPNAFFPLTVPLVLLRGELKLCLREQIFPTDEQLPQLQFSQCSS